MAFLLQRKGILSTDDRAERVEFLCGTCKWGTIKDQNNMLK
ncbi:hypothetical protein DEAC_c19410 [Desulfosporosinus acididurans]|uniref:Uncharacterized protein n=1 Tax=Desulfosporosinus acididurans TaxID=476652 RepID=A0A0J1FRG5_9FIRM|nr:hypothetical protein DEAC_c19410 [Desulfosporosinus acididurans]